MASISKVKIKMGEVKPVKDLIVITIVVCRLWLQSLRVNVRRCILYSCLNTLQREVCSLTFNVVSD